MRFMRICGVLLYAFFITIPVSASGVILLTDQDSVSIGKNISVLEDRNGSLTIDQVRTKEYESKFIPSDDKVPYFGFTSSVYWVRFTLRSGNSTGSRWYLEMGYPLMDNIEFYSEEIDGRMKMDRSGYSRPFAERQFHHRHFVYAISLPDNRPHTFYYRFSCADRMEIPLVIYSLKGFQRYDHNSQYVLGMFFGFIVFMVIYNLLLYFSIRDRTYLIYCFFLLSYAGFQITQNGTAYEYFWPSFLYKYNHFISITISLMDYGVILFTRTFLDLDLHYPRMSKVLKAVEIYLIVTIFLPLVMPYWVIIWIMMVTSIFCCILVITTGTVSLNRNRKSSILYLCGWTAFLSGGILYALKVAGIVPSGFFVNHAMQFGSALQFIILSFGLGIRINVMRVENEAALQQELFMQKRFSIIAENTDDLIFSLDENLNFLTMNNAVYRFLPEMKNTDEALHFLSIISADNTEISFSRQIILDRIESAQATMTPLNFKADFITRSGLDPIEMHVRLEFLTISGRNEIIGRAWMSREDSIMQYFLSEKQEFSIGNLLSTVDEISHRLTRNLGKYLDYKENNLIRLGVREIILNAIEHGNLNISYEEKTDALQDDNYFKLIETRRKEPENKDKKVHLIYSITPAKAVYRITDSGNGFDYRNISDKLADVNENMLAHGRGILMAQNIFDKVVFNDKGNSVTLVKYFVKDKIPLF